MATKEENAQLSLYVYNIKDSANEANRPLLPTGWEKLEYHPDNFGGFSYGVFKRTGSNEIVMAFTGSNENLVADFLGTNIPAGLGLPSLQISNSALAYEKALQSYGADPAGSNISFTGHSLGGGLASVMAVWYNRPAVTFDEAPFQLTATSYVQLGITRAISGMSV